MMLACGHVTWRSVALAAGKRRRLWQVTKRTGWVKRGVQGPESIADHMYRMGIMSLIAGHSGVDVNRAIKIAIVHDITESIVGDIAPDDGVSKEEKNRMEVGKDCGQGAWPAPLRSPPTILLPMQRPSVRSGRCSEETRMLQRRWRPYGSNTKRAIARRPTWSRTLTRQGPVLMPPRHRDPSGRLSSRGTPFLQLEMIVQAHEYEDRQGMELQDFFDSTRGRFVTELGKSWADELVRRREARRAAGRKGHVETS